MFAQRSPPLAGSANGAVANGASSESLMGANLIFTVMLPYFVATALQDTHMQLGLSIALGIAGGHVIIGALFFLANWRRVFPYVLEVVMLVMYAVLLGVSYSGDGAAESIQRHYNFIVHAVLAGSCTISMIVAYPLGVQHVQELVAWAYSSHDDVVTAGYFTTGVFASSFTISCLLYVIPIAREEDTHHTSALNIIFRIVVPMVLTFLATLFARLWPYALVSNLQMSQVYEPGFKGLPYPGPAGLMNAPRVIDNAMYAHGPPGQQQQDPMSSGWLRKHNPSAPPAPPGMQPGVQMQPMQPGYNPNMMQAKLGGAPGLMMPNQMVPNQMMPNQMMPPKPGMQQQVPPGMAAGLPGQVLPPGAAGMPPPLQLQQQQLLLPQGKLAAVGSPTYSASAPPEDLIPAYYGSPQQQQPVFVKAQGQQQPQQQSLQQPAQQGTPVFVKAQPLLQQQQQPQGAMQQQAGYMPQQQQQQQQLGQGQGHMAPAPMMAQGMGQAPMQMPMQGGMQAPMQAPMQPPMQGMGQAPMQAPMYAPAYNQVVPVGPGQPMLMPMQPQMVGQNFNQPLMAPPPQQQQVVPMGQQQQQPAPAGQLRPAPVPGQQQQMPMGLLQPAPAGQLRPAPVPGQQQQQSQMPMGQLQPAPGPAAYAGYAGAAMQQAQGLLQPVQQPQGALQPVGALAPQRPPMGPGMQQRY